MTRELVYYGEINIACICVMAVLLLSDLRKQNDHEPRLFLCLTVSNIFFCLSDIAAVALRGTNFAYSNVALWAVNIIYVVSMCMLSYFWFVYSFAVINRKFLGRKFILAAFIPALLSIVLTASSIKTGWIFSINEANLYSRGPLIWIQWAQQWIYLIAPSIIALFKYINKRNNDLLSVAFFMIPPFIAGAVQMLYYGVTALQVGATISILVVYLRLQNKQIFMDSLTGVFNRGALNKNLERLLASQDQYFYILMIDLNDFKKINDVYGHLKGDLYLTEFAAILKNIAATSKEKASIFRYGGDEFVVLGLDANPNSAADYVRSIYASVNEFNRKKILPIKMSASIGITQGLSSSYTSIDEILMAVDSDMYSQKVEHKKRQNKKASLGAQVNISSERIRKSNVSSTTGRHSMDVHQKDLNRAVMGMWLLIVSVLAISYLLEVAKGLRTIPYYIVFVAITVLPWICGFVYYWNNKDSKNIGYIAVFSYLAMYCFVMLTGSTNMVFSYVLVFMSLLVLYHSPKMILAYGSLSLIINIISIVYKYSMGIINIANSKDFEIQIALLTLCFINTYIAAVMSDKLTKANKIYVDDLKRTNDDIRAVTMDSIITIANTIDAKDEYTKGHSNRVAEYASLLAKKMHLPDEEISNIYSIALLHDIGKIGVPDAILNKPGKLTDEEYKIIQQHTIVGSNILKDYDTIKGVDVGTRYHHERFDGKGYPDGLAGHNIPLIARVIAVADSFDAMTSNRVYRNKLDLGNVIQELEKGKGTQFDPEVADCMIQLCNEGLVPVEKK